MKHIKHIFIILIIAIFLLFMAFLYSRYIEPNQLIVKHMNYTTKHSISSCKIVFFADLHVGKYYSEDHLEHLVDTINKEQPDLVLFGGDFYDNYKRDRDSLDLTYITDCLNKIQATYGKYAIYGNHDYGGAAANVFRTTMEDGGFTLLRNDSIYLDALQIQLIGLDDCLFGTHDASMQELPEGGFNLLLTHEPDVAATLHGNGETLVLAGHSHGGQVSLPFLTDKVLPTGARYYIKGFYEYPELPINEDSKLFVTSGIGMTGKPYRFLNVPEIISISFGVE